MQTTEPVRRSERNAGDVLVLGAHPDWRGMTSDEIAARLAALVFRMGPRELGRLTHIVESGVLRSL